MRGKSHMRLGEFLAQQYMTNTPQKYIRAFLIGCIEPDRNPVTYLKGSIKFQWLRGHNYRNAKNFMNKLSRRLEARKALGFLDYYALGKLIHYTADSFTSAHNDSFPEDLELHREYEAALQDYFLNFLAQQPNTPATPALSVMDVIRSQHREYSTRPTDIHTDSIFAFSVCCCVLAILLPKPII